MKKLYFFGILAGLIIFFQNVSCINFDKVKGSGNVTKTDRNLSGFTAISAGSGIEVIISQTGSESVIVETDDNVQEHVVTRVDDNELKISIDRIRLVSSSIKVHVSVKDLYKLDASSGSHFRTTNQIESDMIKMESSSGSDIKMDVKSKYVTCNSSSGSHISVRGTTNVLDVESSSGSDIKTQELFSETCKAHASSGAHIVVNVSDEIIADVSSGGNVKVFGNPKNRNVKKSSGGNVDFE